MIGILAPIWHQKATTTRKLRQRIRAVMEWAMAMEIRPDNPCDRIGPALRSSFRDWAAEETDHPLEVAEAALAHVVRNQVEAAYRLTDLFERRRRLMDDWADYLAGERLCPLDPVRSEPRLRLGHAARHQAAAPGSRQFA